MDLVIDRSKWMRGEEKPGKLLRKSDGKMCCLGFFSLACGLKPDEIIELGEPQEPFEHAPGRSHEDIPPAMAFLINVGEEEPDWDEDGEFAPTRRLQVSKSGETLMGLNDDTVIAESDREEQIAGVFAMHGVRVTFVDGDGADRPAKAIISARGAKDPEPR